MPQQQKSVQLTCFSAHPLHSSKVVQGSFQQSDQLEALRTNSLVPVRSQAQLGDDGTPPTTKFAWIGQDIRCIFTDRRPSSNPLVNSSVLPDTEIVDAYKYALNRTMITEPFDAARLSHHLLTQICCRTGASAAASVGTWSTLNCNHLHSEQQGGRETMPDELRVRETGRTA